MWQISIWDNWVWNSNSNSYAITDTISNLIEMRICHSLRRVWSFVGRVWKILFYHLSKLKYRFFIERYRDIFFANQKFIYEKKEKFCTFHIYSRNKTDKHPHGAVHGICGCWFAIERSVQKSNKQFSSCLPVVNCDVILHALVSDLLTDYSTRLQCID